MKDRQLIIEKAWENRQHLHEEITLEAIRVTLALLETGKIRVAEPLDESWKTNEWIKKAIMLYLLSQPNEKVKVGPLEFHDKIALKKDYDKLNIRVVPNAVARYGAYVGPGAIMMPSFINIGAYVGKGSFIDTWSTIGSGAQIGEYVTIAGNVVIGGVLVPVQASPVIIEDHCYIGSGCVIEGGVHIQSEVIIGAKTVINKHTPIIDVSGIEPLEYRGFIPSGSVVMAGSKIKKFQAGEYNIPVALIVGKREENPDKKMSLDGALKKYKITV